MSTNNQLDNLNNLYIRNILMLMYITYVDLIDTNKIATQTQSLSCHQSQEFLLTTARSRERHYIAIWYSSPYTTFLTQSCKG